MKLTVETHPESIKRYAHVKPARVGRSGRCGTRCPGTARTCTLEGGHRGPHVGHDTARKVAAVWDASVMRAAGRSAPTPGPRGARGRGVGGQEAGGGALLPALWNRVRPLVSSFESFLFLVLFLAFVWFAFDWLLLIL